MDTSSLSPRKSVTVLQETEASQQDCCEHSRFHELCDVITNVAAIVLALYLSVPIFFIGVAGAVVSGVRAITHAVTWMGNKPGWKKDAYYPLMGEILSGAALVTTLGCGIMVASAIRIARMPALFCTLVGYFAPPNLYHKVYPWPDKLAAHIMNYFCH